MSTGALSSSEEPEVWHSLPSAITGGLLYAVLALVSVLSAVVLATTRKRMYTKAVPSLLHVVLFALCMEWFGTIAPSGSGFVITSLNHLGFCFFFTNFSLIILFCVRQFVGDSRGHDRWVLVAELGTVCSNVLVYMTFAFLLALCRNVDGARWPSRTHAASWASLTPRAAIVQGQMDSPVVHTASITIICVTAIPQVVVMSLAGLLYWRNKDAWWFDNPLGDEMRKVTKVAAVFCCCCLLRIAAFVAGSLLDLDEYVFYLFGYWIPEGVSSALQVYVIHSGEQYRAENTVVEQLMSEAMDHKRHSTYSAIN
eukprot:m51a1_g6443 hypothetical protein (311) ;mRNA; f:386643-388057